MGFPTGVTATATIQVLALTSPTLSDLGISNSQLSLQFTGQPGLTYQGHSTTNLSLPANWQTDQSFYSTGGVISVAAPPPTDAMRFYRL